MIGWLKRLFLSDRYYEYQNLAARYKLYNGAPYELIAFGDGGLTMQDGDFLLDKMDTLWKDMSWIEKRAAERWVKVNAILPE
jgi:hypothetical protein